MDNDKLTKYAILPVAGGLIGLFGYSAYLNSEQKSEQSAYEGNVRPICNDIMSRFDKDGNGALDYNEGMNMARTLGVNHHGRILSRNPFVMLEPINDWARKMGDKKVWLTIGDSEGTVGYQIPVEDLRRFLAQRDSSEARH